MVCWNASLGADGNLQSREQASQFGNERSDVVGLTLFGRFFQRRSGRGQLVEAGSSTSTFDPVSELPDADEIGVLCRCAQHCQLAAELLHEFDDYFAELGVVGRQTGHNWLAVILGLVRGATFRFGEWLIA